MWRLLCLGASASKVRAIQPDLYCAPSFMSYLGACQSMLDEFRGPISRLALELYFLRHTFLPGWLRIQSPVARR